MNFPKIETNYEHVNSFINEVAPLVCNEYLRRKSNGDHLINPSVVIAQACVESGYNLDAETLFGIKGSDVVLDTTEFIDGEYVNVQAGFKKFPSIAGAVEGYYDNIQWDNYADATTPVANTWEEQIEGLTNDIGYPYATAPDYKETITNVINDWGLVIFDSFVLEYKEEEPTPEPEQLTEEEIDALANDVIAGKYGNGKERKDALGENYDAVQARVDEILNGYTKAVEETSTIKEGDHVKFTGEKDYYGTPLIIFSKRPYYTVKKVKGNMAKLYYNDCIYADVNVADCKLV